MKRFGFGTFFVSTIVLFVFTFLSLVAAFGRDEGTLEKDDGIVRNLLADSFDIFRQPTHGLFWDLIVENGGLYMPGLLFNILFWSLLVERTIFLGVTIFRKVRARGKAS